MDLLTYVVMRRLFTGTRETPVYEYYPLSFWDPKTLGAISAAKTVDSVDGTTIISLDPMELGGFVSIMLMDMDKTQTGKTETEYELPIGKLALLGVLSPFYL